MSLNKNIAANYVSLIYTTLVGIFVLPVLHVLMGSEAFGLIGFYAMLQFWFVLIDFGLSATLSRECSRCSGGILSEEQLIGTIKSVEFVFRISAVIGTIVILILADSVSSIWLSLEKLSKEEVSIAIQLMGVSIAIRWVSGLYRGILNGFERQVWTSWFAIFIATLRYPLSIFFIKYIDATPIAYFAYQIVISFIEYFLVSRKSKSIFTKSIYSKSIKSISNLRSLIRISMSLSVLGAITTLITQIDKLSLSRILSLSEYGDFSLMSMLASGIILLGGPFSSAVIPRMSKLVAEHDLGQLVSIYKRTSLFVSITVFSVASFSFFFAYEILYLWTSNVEFSEKMKFAFGVYAIANALFVVSSFPHYLQFAYGDLKLQIGIALTSMAIFIPLSIFLSLQYGIIGAAQAWLTVNVLMILFGTAIVHAKFIPNQHFTWLFRCIAPALIMSLAACFLLDYLVAWSDDKIFLGLQLGLSVFFVLFCASLSSFGLIKSFFSRQRKFVRPDELVILSRSVGLDAISNRILNTSSQNYEVGLIDSLSKFVKVRLEFVGGLQDATKIVVNERLVFINRGRLSFFSSMRLIKYLILSQSKKNIKIITTGYYPLEMIILNIVKIFKIEAYSVVFDTHQVATSYMPFAKKVVSDTYFGFGFFSLRKLNGIIVLNDEFIWKNKIKTRVLKSKVGFDAIVEKPNKLKFLVGHKRPVILFAGTLNADNGIDVILETLKKRENLNVTFRIFGSGPKAKEVEDYSRKDDRLEFMGLVNDDILKMAMCNSDYLICLRNPESLSSGFSFPSKLIKFMGSGVPVIANEFSGLSSEYKNHLILTDFSFLGLEKIIRKLDENDITYRVGDKAAEFIQKTHGWHEISGEIYNFVFFKHK